MVTVWVLRVRFRSPDRAVQAATDAAAREGRDAVATPREVVLYAGVSLDEALRTLKMWSGEIERACIERVEWG